MSPLGLIGSLQSSLTVLETSDTVDAEGGDALPEVPERFRSGDGDCSLARGEKGTWGGIERDWASLGGTAAVDGVRVAARRLPEGTSSALGIARVR